MASRSKFVLGLVVFTVVLRLIPYLINSYNAHDTPSVIFYPWNFTPLMAVCLYSGAYISDRRWAFAVPLVIQFAIQVGIWMLTGRTEWAFQRDCWILFVCYGAAVLLGTGLGSQAWPVRGLSALGRGIFAESVFFVVTNFTYFLVQSDLPHSPAGLVECYVAAIPFAWKSFVSTAFYSVLLFSPVAAKVSAPRQTSPQSNLAST